MRRQRGVNAGLLMLFAQIYQMGLNNIPPVTLATLALNIYLFIYPLKPLLYVCISVHAGYYQAGWERLLLSPFHHADDWHLYFNMVSFLWKGKKLENSLGSILFALIIAVFSQLIGLVYIFLEIILANLMDDPSYKMQCAVGFSGVLFALKVLINHYHPGGSTNVFGFPVSNRYACWVELVAIHVISPGTSFVGHLSGILVGLLYTHGPLKTILTTIAAFVTNRPPQRNYNYNSAGYAGYPNYQQEQYNTRGTYDLYTGGLNEDEQLQRAIRESLNERGGHRRTQLNDPWSAHEDSAEEIRRRRLNRFERQY